MSEVYYGAQSLLKELVQVNNVGYDESLDVHQIFYVSFFTIFKLTLMFLSSNQQHFFNQSLMIKKIL
jgi:hypothetical protein